MAILVVGSTGLVGGQIALQLQRSGQPTRGLVRGGNAHPKASGLREAGIEIATGDLTLPETLAAACTGVDTVVCTATSMPTGANDGLRRVDHDGAVALIDAAERVGVRKFVYTSYSGNIREDSPLETAKRDCENRLLQGRMQAVILRPSYFMEVWLSPALGFDPANGSVRIYGSGEAKVSYISVPNVVEFAVAAAARGYSQKNTILEMGGPDDLSQLDAARTFEQVLGRKIDLSFVPVEALRDQHSSADPLQKTFGALTTVYAKGDVVRGARALAEQYGIKLRSVAEYAEELRGKSRSVA